MLFIILASLCIVSYGLPIVPVGNTTIQGDSSGWVCGDAANYDNLPYQVWVSQQSIYFFQIIYESPSQATFSLLGSSTIPSGMHSNVVLFSQLNVQQEQNCSQFEIFWIPNSQPDQLMILQFSYGCGNNVAFQVVNQTTIQNIPPNTVWELILGYSVNDFTNYFVWVISIDNIAFVGAISGLSWIATIPIPNDPFFPVTKVTGAGYSPNAIYNEFAGPIFVTRSVGAPDKGGDIVVYNVNSNGIPVYDHTVYLLQGSQLSFGLGDGGDQYAFMQWSQTLENDGVLYQYSWVSGSTNLTTINVEFNINEQWGPTYVVSSSLDDFALVTSYVPGTLGYTLRSISFTPGEGFQVETLYVPGDPVPNIGLAAADYNQQIIGAVEGNKDGSTGLNKLSAFNYVYEGARRRSSSPFIKYFDNFEKKPPPSCNTQASCLQIGHACNPSPPENCYLDDKTFFCCSTCPNDC